MKLSSARILVSNDDGIHALGLKVLEKIAKSLSKNVWVVAPETEQSASGHSLTLTVPLRVRKVTAHKYAVNGTPTDCVLLAVNHIMRDVRPDLVLSGVNAGGNLGEDVTYSGTVAAAMEAALMGIPAIALSQVRKNGSPVRWSTAQHHGADTVRLLCDRGWPSGVFLNANFPDVPHDRVAGMRATRQGQRKIGDVLNTGIDPRGHPYVWIGAERDEDPSFPGSDLEAVHAALISVTPLGHDLTHKSTLATLRKALRGKDGA